MSKNAEFVGVKPLATGVCIDSAKNLTPEQRAEYLASDKVLVANYLHIDSLKNLVSAEAWEEVEKAIKQDPGMVSREKLAFSKCRESQHQNLCGPVSSSNRRFKFDEEKVEGEKAPKLTRKEIKEGRKAALISGLL